MEVKKPYVGGLDLVRLAAAVLVASFHLAFAQWADPASSQHAISLGAANFEELSPIAWSGWVGVEIFFVISGFVIAESAEGRDALSFLKGRLKRLVPTNAICATVVLLVFLGFGISHWKYDVYLYVRTLAFIPLTFFPPFFPWLDTVYWSLTVEVGFYTLVFSLLLAGLFRWIEVFAGALAIYSAAYFVGRHYEAVGIVPLILLAQHACFFSLGIVIWLCSSRGLTVSRFLIALLGIAGCVTEIFYQQQYQLSFAPSAIHAIPVLLWASGTISVAVFSVAGFSGTNSTRMLGRMTYPIYLLHSTVGCAILRATPFVGKYPALFFALIVSCLAALAVVQIEGCLSRSLNAVRLRKALTQP